MLFYILKIQWFTFYTSIVSKTQQKLSEICLSTTAAAMQLDTAAVNSLYQSSGNETVILSFPQRAVSEINIITPMMISAFFKNHFTLPILNSTTPMDTS